MAAQAPLAMRRLLVTRPEPQAHEWVDRLRAVDLRAQALPLIAIHPADDALPLCEAWSRLAQLRLVMFVSPNAAAAFFSCRPEGQAWPPAVQVASPGPGTTEVLRGLGVPATHIVAPGADAAQFDSESLWAALAGRSWDGAEVLIVRGTVGRDWLAERLREAGARVGIVAAYRRGPPQLSSAEGAVLDEAIALPNEHLWLFSSSEAVGHLQALRPQADWSRAVALATHPRIAERVRASGWALVHEARPSFEALVACIQSNAS